MSDDDRSTNTDESGEVTLYECRKCPGLKFTAAEKDVHRLQHSRGEPRAPAPSGGRGRSRSSRNIEPAEPSEVTLFRELPREGEGEGDDEAASPSSSRGRKRSKGKGKGKPKKARKERPEPIKPIHHYDKTVKPQRNGSG